MELLAMGASRRLEDFASPAKIRVLTLVLPKQPFVFSQALTDSFCSLAAHLTLL